MTKPNNPYARPIDATKESAVLQMEYDGTRATDKVINHAAGGRNVAPASRYQAVGNSNSPTSPSHDTTSPSPASKKGRKAKPEEAVITAEDLFG